MSRKTIGRLFFCYFVACLGFAAFEAWLDPLWTANTETISMAFGKALAIYLMGAILPMIGWAFASFRAEAASGPLLFWALISVVLAIFNHIGDAYEREEKIGQMTTNGVLTGKSHDDFIRSMKLSCAQTQRANPLTAKIGLSKAKIAAYCDCMATGLVAAITVEELQLHRDNGEVPHEPY
jgi:hypothetical protein